MTTQIIPVTPLPHQTIETVLDNIAVSLTLRWNEIAASWKLDFVAIDGSFTLRGLRLSPGTNLLEGMAVPELGGLFVSDTAGEYAEPTYTGLGDRFLLWYAPLSDMSTINALLG